MKFLNILCFFFRVEAFDEHDLESKFIALSLAFKTDRATLNKRLELHKRQRDMAEKNVENEFQSMRDHLCALNLKATSSDVRDLISKIQNHLDIAQQATSRVSGRSETYGAVQQEERVSRAFEVLVLHVDHLKRLFDKEHKELEDTRRMLTDTRGFRKEVASDVVSEDQKKYSKTLGLPLGSIKSLDMLFATEEFILKLGYSS
ncbi:lymphoid-restricted membrane protein [Trichonephila clavipes]|nr:lymphoid-restricted membrane protein [Trichonephila clavipes]